MRRMDLTHVVAIVLSWTGAAAPPAAQVEAMAREADALWRAHGVAIVLVAPDARLPPVPPASRLTVSLGTVRRAAPSGPADTLGAIVFDALNRPATELTLHVSSIAATVGAARWSGHPLAAWPPAFADYVIGRALGRVLAHEIGHYLLAWRGHSPHGLMREAFDGHQLSHPDRSSFVLAPPDLPRLRARLAGLSRSGSLAENGR